MTRVARALSAGALPLAVAAATFTVAVGLPAGDPDMWWHLASGRWMVEHREEIRVDVFSSTATGEPYALGEPLGEIVLYLAYAAGSWTGIAIQRASLIALAAFSVTRLALRGAPARVAIPLAALAILLSKPTWADRPQLFTLALFPLLLDLCLAARSGSRAAAIATVPIIAVWAPLHGGYALGIALLWLFALDAVLERRSLAAPLATAIVTTALASAAPGALSLLRAAGHVAGSTVRIVEESPVDPLTPFGAVFALFVGATIFLFMLRGASLIAAIVLVPVLGLALSAQRHVPLFGFAAVPFLAVPLTSVAADVGTTLRRMTAQLRSLRGGPPVSLRGMHVFPRRSGTDPRQLGTGSRRSGTERSQIGSKAHTSVQATRSPREDDLGTSASSSKSSSRSRLALPLAGALWLGALASIATAMPAPDLRPYPAGARSALSSSSGILLNEYDWGGYLIWTVPSRPVFVDGRLYPFAGNGVIDAYQSAIHVLPSWRGVIARWNVGQALLRPDRALVQALRDDGWTVRARGDGFVLLERPR
jgi:hypothetical protein